MKRFSLVLLMIVVCFFSLIPLTCYALDFDPRQIHLEYQDVPEGTAYIDVLAQISDTDEAYTDFNVAPKRLADKSVVNGNTEFIYNMLDIDENSEIAKYNDDGYISLSIHSIEIRELVILKDYGYKSDYLKLDCYADDLYRKYGTFKIAYIGENGEILKITGKTGRSYSNSEPYAFVANGDNVAYRSFGTSPLNIFLIVTIILAVIILIVIIPILFIIKKGLKSLSMSKKDKE